MTEVEFFFEFNELGVGVRRPLPFVAAAILVAFLYYDVIKYIVK